MKLPLALTSTSVSPSQDANYRRCINLFAGPAGLDSEPNSVLLPSPGLKTLVDVTAGSEVRAIMNFDDTVYAVVSNKVYKLTINDGLETATAAEIGTISTTTGPISWDRNPTQIMMVDGDNGYILTVSTDTLAHITDNDFTGADTVVFFDSYFFYNTPNAATMYATDINDGSSVDALNVATAEGKPDQLVGLAVDKRELWAFGKKSIEIWWNAANPTGFPLARREGAYIDIGCAAKNSITEFNNTLMWLDNRKFVVYADGYQPQIVSTPEITAEIESYDTIEDAIGFEFTHAGHIFYGLTFPTERKTLVYDSTTQLWHQLADYDDALGFIEYPAQVTERYKTWVLAGSRLDGKISIIDADTYTYDGNTIHRLFTTAHFATDYNFIGVDGLELHAETGKGTVSGDGSSPEVQLRYSNDGGYTWSYSLARDLGALGNYDTRVRWNRLGAAREWLFEFRVAEPIKVAFINLTADVSVGRNS